jgi:threonine/homoserine/homoserine lactone efflux protein
MPLDHFLAFIAASAVLLAIPGPTVLLVVSYAIGHGRRPAAALVAGVALGDLTAMTASMLGLGVVLATSAELFTVLRWIGGAYLVWLGLALWRAPVAAAAEAETESEAPTARPWRMFLHCYAVTALNPKSIVFFIAFVPQFLAHGQAMLPQMTILVASFVTLATLNATLYVLLATAARQRLRAPRLRRAMNRAGGTLLVGAGVAAASGMR